MAFVTKKRSVLSLFRMIWNELLEAFEVFDKASGRFCELRNASNEVIELNDENMAALSADMETAEKAVSDGLKQIKDVYEYTRRK